MRAYEYVGPDELLQLVNKSSDRFLIQSEAEVRSWAKQTKQQLNGEEEIIATFIVDIKGRLWIADRHSEHVVCAAGAPVLSAGEMTFHFAKGATKVSAVTNQSTGFCPEPESWASVEKVLNEVGLIHPQKFTTCFDFRLCIGCGAINLVKEDWFICSMCDAELEPQWNFSRA
jgi:hypothetical protein